MTIRKPSEGTNKLNELAKFQHQIFLKSDNLDKKIIDKLELDQNKKTAIMSACVTTKKASLQMKFKESPETKTQLDLLFNIDQEELLTYQARDPFLSITLKLLCEGTCHHQQIQIRRM